MKNLIVMPCMRIWVLILLLLASAGGTIAQTTQTDTLSGGSIIVHQDSRIDLLVKKQAEYNEKVNLTRKFSHGFRIQVLNTTDRNEATAVKTKLLQAFPGEKVYLLYQEPYFKIRFGNFRNRPEAEDFLKQIEKLYPGIFVIPSPIEPKPEWFREGAEEGTM
jgi:hypothetical protein